MCQSVCLYADAVDFCVLGVLKTVYKSQLSVIPFSLFENFRASVYVFADYSRFGGAFSGDGSTSDLFHTRFFLTAAR